MTIIATSYLISVIAIVLTREFKKINEDLEKAMNDVDTQMNGSTAGAVFCKPRDNFFKLVSVVQKVDEMFCVFYGYTLALSLGSLCWSLYAIFVRVESSERYAIPTTGAVAALMILLPSSASLNSEVRWLSFFQSHSIDSS